MDFFAHFSNPYMGILTYIVAPGFLITGIALTLFGAWRERRRRRHSLPGVVPEFPRIDLNQPRQRRAFILVTIATIGFLLLTALGSYQTYHFTESVMFCGQTCHSVMKPEYTAYQHSPHARVACVQCHIGPGADWFVKSKLSGSYQVYSVMANKYPRPIPTPIPNLRPSQETCEQCHWPAKFYGSVVRNNPHYLADATNTPWTIRLIMKIGGGSAAHGPVGGIHWHVSDTEKVEYVATDPARQKIPWVRVTHADGQVTVYQSKDGALSPEKVAQQQPRRMDCIDCHNRPSHVYNAPSRSVDLALSTGRIDPKMPNIKKLAVEALIAEYATEADAMRGIAAKVPAPAVAAVQEIYRQNFFPEMKVSWQRYPNNIGHTIFPGCYRCHDGQHVSADGRKIRHDCNLCHVIIAQGPGPEPATISPAGLEFQHPADLGDVWKDTNCTDCHNGALAGQ
jgi:nitrate/TMAO reductase-like tetraheme cytochrome c subunit